MSWFIAVGEIMVLAGFCAALLMVEFRKTFAAAWIPLVVFIAIGFAMIGTTIIGNAKTVNHMYAAAYKQHLFITTSTWGQTPSTTAPCEVKLRYDDAKKQLFLAGADTLATPEVLAAVCK